jgi:hypothetical protein
MQRWLPACYLRLNSPPGGTQRPSKLSDFARLRPHHRRLEPAADTAASVDEAESWQESIAASLVPGRWLCRGPASAVRALPAQHDQQRVAARQRGGREDATTAGRGASGR